MTVCRICLGSKPKKDITQLKSVVNEEKYGYEKIMWFCLNIQIVEDSKMSTKLCTKCFKKIIEFHQFKHLALKNDAYLQSVALQYLNDKDFAVDENKIFQCNENKASLCDTDASYLQYHTPLYGNGEDSIDSVKLENSQGVDDQNVDSSCHYDEDLLVKEECIEVDQTIKEPVQITYEYIEVPLETETATEKINQPQVKKTKKRKKKNTITNLEICPECGKQVKSLKEHSLIHYPLEERQTHECELCNKVFRSIGGKKSHIRKKHRPDAKKQCHLCDIAVLNLKQHIQAVHERDNRPHKCALCNKKYLYRRELIAHLSIHTHDRPFECEECKQCFRTNHRMLIHKRRMHNKEKSYCCDICAKSFFKKETLVTHLRLHTRETPYQCPDCDKAFVSATSLKHHRYDHGKPKFECTECGKMFHRPKYLSTHMKTHSKEKKYSCRYCTNAYHRSDHRSRHEMNTHKKNGASLKEAPS